MKKLSSFVVLLAVVFGLALVTAGCTNSPPAPKQEPTGGTGSTGAAQPDASVQEVQYTCSMHPEVVTSAPGKCPKCNMDLVVKK